MLSENILWARAINPASGRIMHEPTILGVVLVAVVIFFLASVFFYPVLSFITYAFSLL
jgi:hypothetical protein